MNDDRIILHSQIRDDQLVVFCGVIADVLDFWDAGEGVWVGSTSGAGEQAVRIISHTKTRGRNLFIISILLKSDLNNDAGQGIQFSTSIGI